MSIECVCGREMVLINCLLCWIITKDRDSTCGGGAYGGGGVFPPWLMLKGLSDPSAAMEGR